MQSLEEKNKGVGVEITTFLDIQPPACHLSFLFVSGKGCNSEHLEPGAGELLQV